MLLRRSLVQYTPLLDKILFEVIQCFFVECWKHS